MGVGWGGGKCDYKDCLRSQKQTDRKQKQKRRRKRKTQIGFKTKNVSICKLDGQLVLPKKNQFTV
jgi:hypothetical protein